MIYEMTQTSQAAALFEGREETMILSCLQGIMGRIYTTDQIYSTDLIYSTDPIHGADLIHDPSRDTKSPASAMAVLGDFTFFAGRVSRELISFKPKDCTQDFMIMVGQNEEWNNAIAEHYGAKATVVSRYAFQKEPNVFDRKKLMHAASSLPDRLESDLIDEQIFHLCKANRWSADLVSQFKDYEEYRRLGLGVVIHKGPEIYCGASSYSRYHGGIEVEIDTREDHRRQGLAYACGARLILECLKRNLYPSWDAQNPWSAALAHKLGYHYSHTYPAVEIHGY